MQNPEISFQSVKHSIFALLTNAMKDYGKICVIKIKRKPAVSGVSVQIADLEGKPVIDFPDFFDFVIAGQIAGASTVERIQLKSVLKLKSYLDPIKEAVQSAEADVFARITVFEKNEVERDESIAEKDTFLVSLIGGTDLKYVYMSENGTGLGDQIREIQEDEIAEFIDDSGFEEE